eukprot:CAMPEP_0172935658 /NCGR_PEP_ID=MMETSP1075-20121228/221625_1 /TAXON_ID=2916 /ORGANISM="Ceratium fusus, Strain PA161109" /LENGTH=62 /DNA_ID=CAMNT_0013797017 /DNA_START=538 /DNA_END=727 /DNA_ORIENTATION=+
MTSQVRLVSPDPLERQVVSPDLLGRRLTLRDDFCLIRGSHPATSTQPMASTLWAACRNVSRV